MNDVNDVPHLSGELTDDLHVYALMQRLRELWQETNDLWRKTYDPLYEGMMMAYDNAMQLVERLFGVKVEEESGGMNNGMD